MTEGRPARLVDYVQHRMTCNREIMRNADDSAKYLSEPCTCGLAALVAASGAPPQDLREQIEKLPRYSFLEVTKSSGETADGMYQRPNGGYYSVADVLAIFEENKQ